MEAANKIAEYLLSIKAFKFNLQHPYTWASGWRSPAYCDNRLTLSYPGMRSFIADSLAAAIRAKFADVEAIAGVATAGIPYGALVADRLRLPFMYVRAQPKTHGMGNQIEGGLYGRERVVVLEDLVSTGKSCLAVVDALREAEAEVIGVVSIFNYCFPETQRKFQQTGVQTEYLLDLSTLVAEAIKLNYLDAAAVATLEAWRADPAQWSPQVN
jgi:orotate phosphoribosyltransferase